MFSFRLRCYRIYFIRWIWTYNFTAFSTAYMKGRPFRKNGDGLSTLYFGQQSYSNEQWMKSILQSHKNNCSVPFSTISDPIQQVGSPAKSLSWVKFWSKPIAMALIFVRRTTITLERAFLMTTLSQEHGRKPNK